MVSRILSLQVGVNNVGKSQEQKYREWQARAASGDSFPLGGGGGFPPRSRAAAGSSDPDRASRLGSIARGFVDQGAEMLDTVGQLAYDMSLAPGARQGGESDLIPDAGERATGLTGIPPASDELGVSLERAGEGMAMAVPFGPLAIKAGTAVGVSPVIAVLAEMGLAGFGGLLEGELDQAGRPGLGMAAAVAAGFPATAAGRLGQKAASRADDLYKSVRKMTNKAVPYMDELGVSRRSLVRASEELKRRVPDVDETAKRLKYGESVNEQIPGGFSSRQLIDTMPNARGGPAIAAMDERLSRDSLEYGRQSSRRRADMLDYLAREWGNLGGDEAGDFIEFLARYDDGMVELKQMERAAWRIVREGDQPKFNMTSIQRYIANTIDPKVLKLEDDRAAIPQVFMDILDATKFTGSDGKLATEFSLNDFQNVRSVLLEIMRESKMAPSKVNRRAASFALPVLKRMERQIKAWDKADDTGRSMEYLTAKRITRENKSLYDMDSPIIRVLDQGGNERNLFTALRNSRGRRGKRFDSTGEAERLKRVADQTPGGAENLRRMAISDLFHSGLEATKTRTPLKTLEAHEGAYRVVLGDADYERAVELLEWSQIGTRGAAGTPNQAMRTGSGIAPAQFLFGLASEAVSPTPGVGVARRVAMALKESGATRDELMQLRILVKSLEDPKFMRILLEMPTERAYPAWEVSWRQLLKASSGSTVRQGSRAGFDDAREALE